MEHRNSQKRIYIKNAIYFITTNTFEAYPFFEEDMFCELWLSEFYFCKEFKSFNIYGYKINPDHAHLMIQPGSSINHSEIMRSLKTNVSRNINYLLGYNEVFNLKADSVEVEGKVEGEVSRPRLQLCLQLQHHCDLIRELKNKFKQKNKNNHNLPHFQWQPSFHDHIIRDKSDYYTRLNYIKTQWIKHNLSENKYCYISKAIPDLTYTNQLKFTKQ